MLKKIQKIMIPLFLCILLFLDVILVSMQLKIVEGVELFYSKETSCEECNLYKEKIEIMKQREGENEIIFVGNSLVEGISLNSGSNAVFLSQGGINLEGLKTNIYNSLTYYDCEKVIICMGTNEIGKFDKDLFLKSYQDLVNHIRTINSNSEIFVMSIPSVTEKRSLDDETHNNSNIKLYNTYIEELCEMDKSLKYLDNTQFFTNVLNTEWSPDGVHLYGRIYKLWYEFIMKNV